MAFTLIAGPKNFTGTDGTNLSADTDFFEQNGVTGQLRILTNAYANAFSSMADVCWQGAGSFTADQYVQFTLLGLMNQGDIIGGSLLNNGAVFALLSAYRVYYDSNNSAQACVVSKIVTGGTPSTIGSVAGTLTASDKILCSVVDVSGSKVFQFYRDTGSGFIAYGSTITDSTSPLTTGKPGVCGANLAGGAMRGDDWQAGNVTSSGAVTGTGALTSPSSTISSSGTTRVHATGALTSPSSQISGSGSINGASSHVTGTGTLTSPSSQISGTGKRGSNIIGGPIDLTSPSSQISGTAVLRVHGTGSLISPTSMVSGSGNTHSHSSFSGTGTLISPSSTINGTGIRRISGTGALTSPRPRLRGRSPGGFSPRIEGSGVGGFGISGSGIEGVGI